MTFALADVLRSGEVVTLRASDGQALLSAGPCAVLLGQGQGWVVLDHRADAPRERRTASHFMEAAALLLDGLGPDLGPARRFLSARAYAERFPIGASLGWPVIPLSAWRPPATWGRLDSGA